MIERHRIYILIANPIRNLLFTKVSRAINLPTQTETPQPDVVPSEESDMLGSSDKKSGVYRACTQCNGVNFYNAARLGDPDKYEYICPFGNKNGLPNYSPNEPSDQSDKPKPDGFCPNGLSAFFQLVQAEGATGGSGDPWCFSNTYCFSQELVSSGPNGSKYALSRKNSKPVEGKDGKLEAQTFTDVKPGKNLGAIVPNKKWQSISCEVDGWRVYWKLNSSNCLTAFWDNWVQLDGIYNSCICTDPKKILSTTNGTVQKNAKDEENYMIYPHQFYYETESGSTMSCYFSYDGEFFYIFYSDGFVHAMNQKPTIQLKDSTISMDLLFKEPPSKEVTYEVTNTNTTSS